MALATGSKMALKSVLNNRNKFGALSGGQEGSQKALVARPLTRTESGVSLSHVDLQGARPARESTRSMHAVHLDRERPNLSMEEVVAMYPPEECVIDEMIQRQGLDSQWRRRRAILHQDVVLFIDIEEGIVIDSLMIQDVEVCVRCPDYDDHKNDERAFSFTVRGESDTTTTVYCRSRGDFSAKVWVDKTSQLAAAAQRGPTWLQRYQAGARRIERRVEFSLFAAFLIMANFAMICTEAQVTPSENSARTFKLIDLGFTIAFTIEISIIMSGRLPYKFHTDRWNLFDFLIVSISLVQLIVEDLIEVQQFRLLRMFRVVRVLRVFGKLQQLRHIVDSITRSMVPLADAIFICLMFVFIYATIGVDAWREEAPEAFGDFFRAIWALFSIMTFEDWPPELYPFPESGKVRYAVVFYVYSYVGIINYILLQVLVAVLLESFFSDLNVNVASEEKKGSEAFRLDPLMEVLLMHFNTEDDLANRIAGFFRVFDADNSGSLSLPELQEGIRKLPLERKCNVTIEDFEDMTKDIQLFDDDGEKMVDLAAFDTLMRKELRSFAQRSLAQCIRKTPDVDAQILLGTMKMLLVDSRTTQNMLLSDAQSALGPAKVSERLRSRSPARSRSPQLMRSRSPTGSDGSNQSWRRIGSNDVGQSEHGPRGVAQRAGIKPYSSSENDQDHVHYQQSYDGSESTSCTGIEALLSRITRKLDQVEDTLTPIRRDVRLITNSIAKGALHCNDAKCIKVATASPGKEQSKMFESSMNALSVHAKNLERQVAVLQKENDSYKSQSQLMPQSTPNQPHQLHDNLRMLAPAPNHWGSRQQMQPQHFDAHPPQASYSQHSLPFSQGQQQHWQQQPRHDNHYPLQYFPPQAPHVPPPQGQHQAGQVQAESSVRPQSSSGWGSDWPVLKLQDSTPPTPREQNGASTARSISMPPTTLGARPHSPERNLNIDPAPSTEQNGQIQSGSGYAKTPAEGYSVDLAAVTADVGYLDHSVVQSQSFSASPLHGDPTTIHAAQSDNDRGGHRVKINVSLAQGTRAPSGDASNVYHSSLPGGQISQLPIS